MIENGILIIIIFVLDDSALFTIYLFRGEEREGSWDRTLFVCEVNKTHGLSESYLRQSHRTYLPLLIFPFDISRDLMKSFSFSAIDK